MSGRWSRRNFLARGGALAAVLSGRRSRALLPVETGEPITISGVAVAVSLTVVSEKTLRISVLPIAAEHEPAKAFAAEGLRERSWPPATCRVTRLPAPPPSWGRYRVEIGRGESTTLRITVREGDTLRQELRFDPDTARVSFALGGPVFGLGEGGHQFDRRGVVDAMRNGQFKPDQLVNGGRSPIPWLISPQGWGLYLHHPQGTFDLTGERGVFRPAVAAEAQDIFLVLGEPAELLAEFAALTGFPHLPPVWALGYQQSHRTLASREAVLDEVKTFREKKLPCDVMIYLGTGFAPSGWNTGHASFAFNPKIFPDPTTMFADMHEEQMRVVLHVLGVPFDLHGRVSDTAQEPDNAANYWRDHLPAFRTGVDGWWVDDGDELLPEARLTRNRMYWEGPLAERPNVRPYSIQRNGYAGLQQYGFLWSGDVNSEWKTLRTQIACGLNTGLSGIPYWGTDTGGFFSTRELTAELYVRWFQFSAFCPLFRSHGRTWMLRLPWGWDRGDAGPVEDDAKLLPAPSELHHPEVEVICRKFLDLRYRLLPYTYASVYAGTRSGMPMMRALWLAYPQDERAALVDDAYLWGESVLVAPVTERGATSRTVYLPKGEWWDLWTQERVQGGREHHCEAPLESMPLFVRTGSIVPMGPVKQSATEHTSEPLEVVLYPGADARFELYEDDGVSMEHLRGASSTITMEWRDARRTLTLALAKGSGMHPFTSRAMRVRVAGDPRERSVQLEGPPLQIAL